MIEFAPHIEEIKRALDTEIDDGNIIADLKKLLEYRVPLNEAKRSIIKKYGGYAENATFRTKDKQLHENCELRKLSELRDGEINVHTMFILLNIEIHDINTKEGQKEIIEGIVADENTKLPLTSWVLLPELAVGNTIEVENAYIRSFRGIPTINLNEASVVKKLETKLEYIETKGLKIGDVILKDGAYDIVVEGNILSIRPGSGLISRCPDCSRVIQKGICRAHGKVDEKTDMRIKAIIDDGTGVLTLVLDSKLTQKLSGITIEEAQKIAKTAMSQKAVEEEIRRRLIGKKFIARGNMSKGEFGITLVAADILEPSEDIREKAKKIMGSSAN